MFARVVGAAVIDITSRLPTAARRLSDGAWLCPPDGQWTTPQAESCGWHAVVDTPRPDDTPTTTHDRTIDLVGGVPTVVWTERALTAQEVAARDLVTAQAVYDRALGLLAPDELAATQALALEAEGIADGDPWRQPQGAHDAYPVDAVVTYADKTWVNTLAANVWAPGVTGWSEVTEGVPDWVQPAGAHDAYQIGDHVMHNGSEWVSDVADNVWEPGVYGWSLA